MDLTKEQKLAVETLDSNVLVSASAGSGKTRVLINRILNILQSKRAKLTEMLVMTFTNNAATEMRQRLASELHKVDDEEIKAQLDELELADIFTIHGFCQKVVKEFCYETGIAPNFSILDDREADFLKATALEKVFQTHLEHQDERFLKLYRNFNDSRTDESLKDVIFSAYSFLRSKQNYKVWAYESLKLSYNQDPKQNLALRYFQQREQKILVYFRKKFEDIKLQAEQIKSEKLIECAGAYLVGLNQMASGADIEDMKAYYFPTIALNSKTATADEVECKEKLQEVARQFKLERADYIDAFGGKSWAENQKNLSHIESVLKILLDIVFEFETEYEAIKKCKQVADFDDLQHLCLKTLQNKDIQATLQVRYKFILVDEYQDTSEIQESIIQKVVSGENLFMVGDVKQSIYMFRECNPQIFIDKYHVFQLNQSGGEVIELNKNFRSDKPILDFANFVFNNIMTDSTAQVDYQSSAQLVFGKNVIANETACQVNVKLMVKKEKEPVAMPEQKIYSVLADHPQKEEDDTLEKECLLVAKSIAELKQKQIYDSELKQLRVLDYRDIAILSRKKSAVFGTLKKCLDQFGIPVKMEFENDLYHTYEVKLLHNYLKLIDNDCQDLPLLSVLSSFMVNLGGAELSQIRLQYPSANFFYAAVKKYAEEQKDELSQKLRTLYQDLSEFRLKLSYLDICSLMQSVVQKYQFVTELLKHHLAEDSEKLDFAIANAMSIQEISLSQYLNYIDHFASEKAVRQVVQTTENAVTVSTIHASKGLEYPAVILMNTDAGFSNKSTLPKVITNSELGFGMDYYDGDLRFKQESLVKSAIKMKLKEQEKQEEMRLFYVALTRAKNYLVVSGAVNLKSVEPLRDAYEINRKNNALSWILGSLEEETINQLKEGTETTVTYNGSAFKVELFAEESIEQESVNEKPKVSVTIGNNDSKIFEHIIKTKFSENPLLMKNTVTALLNDEEEYNIKDFTLKGLNRDDDDFALIGTAYHKAMQFLNFKTINENNFNFETEQLLQKKYLSEEEWKAVDFNKIYKAICALKPMCENAEVLKEKQFMMYVPANSLIKTDFSERILLQGVVDLIIKTNDGITLIDYKTSRIKDDKKLAEKYGLQLELYAKALEGFYHLKIKRKMIYSFFLDRLVIV